MNIQILDCTLRDGGYYGNWDFDETTVRRYLAAISTAKVDIIEIGFRLLPQAGFYGAYAYSSDEYLKSLSLPKNVAIAVMINAKDLMNYKSGIEAAVNNLFLPKNKSLVDIVRIAVHINDVENCLPIANLLDKLGYRVFLNLMQVGTQRMEEISNISRLVSSWGCIEVLYFADSLGNMDPESVKNIVLAISSEWDRQIGIHTHDNKGQALLNCIAALDSGVKYIDSTVLGMGRGAGNVKTESLLVEITQRDYGKYFPDALFPLVLQEFKLLQERFGWGPNIYYFLSAVHGIHPTYIQEMLGGERYDTEQILAAINFLKSSSAPFYNFENMLRAISGMAGSKDGAWSAKGWAKNKDVLVIGSGPGTKRYINALQQYVKLRNPIVLCLNINESVPEEMVTAYVACHETRILIESDHYPILKTPLIIPLSRVPDAIKDALNSTEVLDYGLCVQENKFQIMENGCTLSSPLAVAYAISIATAGGAKKILLAGMDGYDVSDPRQKEMIDVLQIYSNLEQAIPICAITPTTYPVEQRSVYEPGL